MLIDLAFISLVRVRVRPRGMVWPMAWQKLRLRGRRSAQRTGTLTGRG